MDKETLLYTHFIEDIQLYRSKATTHVRVVAIYTYLLLI